MVRAGSSLGLVDTVYCAVLVKQNIKTGKEWTVSMGPYKTMASAQGQLTMAHNDHPKYSRGESIIVVAEIRRGDTTWTTIDPVKEKKRLKAEAAELKNKQEEDRLKNAQDDFYKEMWS